MQIEWKTRLCTVNDKLGYFHAWEHYSKPLEECIENDECILDTVNIHVKKV